MPEEFGSVKPAEEPDRGAEPVDLEPPPRLPFPVVGIGASAGGLEAFSELFKAVPPDTGMAFVLIQHLPPDRESLVAELLQRHTSLPVRQVEDGASVAPNHVYIIQPGRTLTLKDGRLCLGERLDRPRHSRPVDDFFRSLAEEQRERAIGVIMSGMGSNGAAGAQAIKAVGGLCIAQDPESAQFPSMPRHLIDAGYADLILPPAEIPEALISYARHPYAADSRASGDAGGARSPHSHQEEEQRAQHQVREVLAIVRTRTRFDFTGYKKPTVLRRIQRRMGLNRITDIGQYAKLLRQSAVEVNGLADDLLIHVTGFFRDPDAWEALRQRVIVPLVGSREPGEDVRCWVAACSSGEEAYSLAMLLVEEAERLEKSINIKVFATDTAERTLNNARGGVYPGGIESDMPPERLQRFFDKDDGGYRVRPELRELVVFAPQNVLNDPPFSRLDIVTCRNLLIYLEPDIQHRVFELVHFGLRDGGALLLGSSETIPSGTGMFEPIDKKARIYKRVGPTRHGAFDFPSARRAPRAVAEHPRSAATTSTPATVGQLTTRGLLALHVPAAVTVDRQCRVVYYQGDTNGFLAQPTGEPTQDVTLLAAEQVRGAVTTALQRSMTTNALASAVGGWVADAAGQRRRVLVLASPLPGSGDPELFIVSFQYREELEVPVVALGADEAPDEVRQPTQELLRLRRELQNALEELQVSSEEHKAAAEEAMSVNEELQSSNEELETSKEEMQSLNEELSTVNAQLHAKMDELQRTTGDLHSLLASTDIAVIFLDPQFRIRRYTPAVRKLIELIGSDVGRPLNDLAKKFADPELLRDARSVLDCLVPAEREVRSDDGRWYARRVLPYRTADDRIEGVVVTFVDISDRKRAQDLAVQASLTISGDLKAMSDLHVATNQLIGARDLPGVLKEILAGALELHAASGGDVRLVESVSQTLRIATDVGISAEFVSAWGVVKLSDPASPWALSLRQQAPAVVDVGRDLPPSSLREAWLVSGFCAVLCIPLLARGGEIMGAITIYFRQPYQPEERLMRVTELFARQGSDMIERIRIEEERARLLRSEQLARRALDDAAQMKDDFLATVSHELRAPLATILLWAKLLRRAGGDVDKTNQGIEAILSSAEAQARLIDDLLDTSRAAAGKLRLELGETDLAQVMSEVIEQNALAASAKNVRVESNLSAAVGVVIADEMRMRQVVWNLLTNAVKFTPEGGQVTVTLDRVGDDVRIEVADTGVGIVPDFLPRIFDRFKQYEASITRKYGGLGLGLAICKQLVEMHGGTIRAESPGLGQGATLTVRLPMPPVRRRTQPAAGQARARTVGAALAGTSVLVVEDDSETRAALALVLQDAGAVVRTAASASEAAAAYRSSPPEILLSDIGLPDSDGYALLGSIRALERELALPAVPAFALTAYAREEDRRKVADAGFITHLAKPVDADQLVLALARVVGHAPPIRALAGAADVPVR